MVAECGRSSSEIAILVRAVRAYSINYTVDGVT